MSSQEDADDFVELNIIVDKQISPKKPSVRIGSTDAELMRLEDSLVVSYTLKHMHLLNEQPVPAELSENIEKKEQELRSWLGNNTGSISTSVLVEDLKNAATELFREK